MVGFGIFIGMLFPFFIVFMGIPSSFVMTAKFFLYCIIAGLVVAIMNIVIVKIIIIKRIAILSNQMCEVESSLNRVTTQKQFISNSDVFLLNDDSEGTLGDSVKAFNRLIVSLSSALKRETDIRSFTAMLVEHLETEKLSVNALKLLLEYLSAEGGLIAYKQNDQLLIGATYGVHVNEAFIENNGLLCIIEKSGGRRINLKQDVSCLSSLEFDSAHNDIIAQPIFYDEMPLGIVVLSKNNSFTEEDLNKLDIFAMGLSIAMSNTISHEKLQKFASIDALTGLYNRRFGMIRLNEEFSRSQRGAYPLGVIFFDIDHFKCVNDSHGHMAGDQVLIRISKLLSASLREGDVLVRYGGEEFLCILPGADSNMTFNIAERMRIKIMESPFEVDNFKINLTISGGISSYPETSSDTPESLINAADWALYKAKKAGRNTIER